MASSLSDRYRTLRRLPDIPGSDCWLVQDEQLAQRLVIRDVPLNFFSRDFAARFENEVQLLKLVQCENYNPLVSYAFQNDRLRMVYRYVDGFSLSRKLSSVYMSTRAALKLACDVLTALEQIHDLGAVHRDLRPSHIVMCPSGPAVLSGYGPSWQASVVPANRPHCLETFRFASPELAGVIKRDIGPASDLYSLGLVLFNALARRPMFNGTTVGEVLRQQATLDVDLSLLPRETSPFLVSFIEKLTKKEPRSRYQSSATALSDARELLREQTSENVTLSADSWPLRTSMGLRDPVLVGRESVVDSLSRHLLSAARGDWVRVQVIGHWGMGTSRLIDEVSAHASKQGYLIFRGNAAANTFRMPNVAWRNIVDQVAAHCGCDPRFCERIRESMSHRHEEITSAMPALASALGWTERKLGGPAELGHGRIISAFAELISNLGSAENPVLLTIENGEAFDAESVTILQRVLATDARHQMLLLSTGMDERVAKLCKPNDLTDRLKLLPLDSQQIRRLCHSMCPELPDEVIAFVEAQSGGNPFLAETLLRTLEDKHAITIQDQQCDLDRDAFESFCNLTTPTNIVQQRIDTLSVPSQQFLNAAAVVGHPFSLDAVMRLTQFPLKDAFQLIAQLRKRRFIRGNPDGTYSFGHGQFRTTLLSQLSPELTKRMHGEVASYFEEAQYDCPNRIAYHYDAAERYQEAFPYALAAAQSAGETFYLETAQEHLRQAGGAYEDVDPKTQHQIESMMNELLLLRHEYDEAESWLNRSERTAVSNNQHAVVFIRRGQLALRRGQHERAVEHFESALDCLQRPVLKNRILFLLDLVHQIGIQAFRSWLPSTRGREPGLPSPSELLRLRVYSLLTHAYWHTRDRQDVLWANLKGLNRIESYQPTSTLAQFYSEHAPAMSLFGWNRRGLRYAERSYYIRRALCDVWGQGQSRHFLSKLLYSSSRFDEAIDESRVAIKALESVGDQLEANGARYQLAASLYRKGNLVDAVRQARLGYQTAEQRNDPQGTGAIVDIWSRASLGQIPFAVLEAEINRDALDTQRICQVTLAHGVYLYYQDRFEEALEKFTEAIQVSQFASVVNAYTSPCYVWQATAMRRVLETNPPENRSALRKLKRALYRSATTAKHVAKTFSNELPGALAEYAAACVYRGKVSRGKRFFQQSIQHAEHQGAEWERLSTVLLRGSFADTFGWPADPSEWESASKSVQSIRDRMEATLQPNSHRHSSAKTTAPAPPPILDSEPAAIPAGSGIF